MIDIQHFRKAPGIAPAMLRLHRGNRIGQMRIKRPGMALHSGARKPASIERQHGRHVGARRMTHHDERPAIEPSHVGGHPGDSARDVLLERGPAHGGVEAVVGDHARGAD